MGLRPAWSSAFTDDAVRPLLATGPLGAITRAWAWGSSTGRGVRLAVIDSGIEAGHPAVGGQVRGGVVVELDASTPSGVRIDAEPEPFDVFGHGTACAGVIHALAPEAELYSVRVFARNMTCKAIQFAAGL